MNSQSTPFKLKYKTYKNLLHGYLKPNIPSYLILYVNNKCQLRCDMCFYWDSMQVPNTELTLNEIINISKGFPNLLQLTLTGGEPSLRKDLAKIPGIFAKYSNLAKCTIVTNGMLYKRIANYVEEMVTENKYVDFRIAVSVDGIGELHDNIRGVKGSYANLIKTLDLLLW